VIRILTFLLFININLFAQTKIDNNNNSTHDTITLKSPYNPKDNCHTWGIKGKILPMFAIGNGALLNTLIGFEYGFKKNQSIGLDAYYLGMVVRDDDSKGIIGNSYRNDISVFLNYRFYFPFEKIRDKFGLAFYTGLFARQGINRFTADGNLASNFNTSNDSLVSSVRRHNSFGLLLGTLYKIKGTKRLCIDFNVGLFRMQTEMTNIDFFNRQTTSTTTISKFSTYNMRVGLNLYWYFFHDKKNNT
jgi:hypothetical protein